MAMRALSQDRGREGMWEKVSEEFRANHVDGWDTACDALLEHAQTTDESPGDGESSLNSVHVIAR